MLTLKFWINLITGILRELLLGQKSVQSTEDSWLNRKIEGVKEISRILSSHNDNELAIAIQLSWSDFFRKSDQYKAKIESLQPSVVN